MEEWQYWSYWVELDLLVPLTFSHLEDHPDSEQGVSTFTTTFAPPSTPDGPHKDVGTLKEYNGPTNEADGGGSVPLPPNEGGRGDAPGTPNQLYVPGTHTVW